MEEAELKDLDHQQIKELMELMVSFYVEKDNSKLDRLFEIYDRNGNGSISADELRTIMRAICPEDVDNDTIQSMIEEADSNHNGEIEIDEFKTVMISRRDS